MDLVHHSQDVNSGWFIKNEVIRTEIINYLIFDKKIVITPDMLQEENPEIKLDTSLIQDALGRSIERRRDLYSSIRIKEDPGTNLFFVGV